MKNMNVSSKFVMVSLLSLGFTTLPACNGSQFSTKVSQVGPAQVTDKNLTPSNPYVIQKMQTKIGFLSLHNTNLKMDKEANTYSLTGHYVLVDKNNQTLTENDTTLSGTIQKDSATSLYPTADENTSEQARARLTCLDNDADGFCRSVIVDFYLRRDGDIFAAQVQIDLESTPAQTPAEQLKPEDQPAPGSLDTDSDDTNEQEGTEDGEQGGLYVGTLYEDPAPLFAPNTVKPVPTVTSPSPKPSVAPSQAPSPVPSVAPSQAPAPSPVPSVTPSPRPSPSPSVAPSVTPVVPSPIPSPAPTSTSSDSRPRDQAVGMVSNGHLENASSLMDVLNQNKSLPISFLYPERKRYYGTYDLLQVIQHMATQLSQDIPGNKLTIGDIAQKTGGKLLNSAHLSHQSGLDADISYPRTDTATPTFIGLVKSDGSISPLMRMQEVYKLFEYANVSLGVIDRIFVDAHIKKAMCDMAKKEGMLDDQGKGRAAETLRRMRPWPGHDNHFHMRIRCSTFQPRCRMMAEPDPGSGC